MALRSGSGAGPWRGSCIIGTSRARRSMRSSGKLELQHPGNPERAGQIEAAIGKEVAQRVRDQPAVIELHPPQHVGPVADDGIGTGIDDRAGPAAQVARGSCAQ